MEAIVIDPNGFHRLISDEEDPPINFLVHEAVWTSFVGPIKDGMEIYHLDGDKDNNALVNLSEREIETI